MSRYVYTNAVAAHCSVDSCLLYFSCIMCCVLTGNGGAVQTAGELKLRSCNLTSNSGLSGGAVYTDNRAVIGMKNCVLTNNTAQQSGELFSCLLDYTQC
jgi:hypothetical protein